MRGLEEDISGLAEMVERLELAVSAGQRTLDEVFDALTTQNAVSALDACRDFWRPCRSWRAGWGLSPGTFCPPPLTGASPTGRRAPRPRCSHRRARRA